jgi:hypothetical protein
MEDYLLKEELIKYHFSGMLTAKLADVSLSAGIDE